MVYLVACTALLALVELAARWWIRWRGQYFVLPPGLRIRLRPDPEVFPELERATRFDVNSEGERGDEVPRVDRLFRALVAGGSQPEGYMLDQETTWPGALQRLLQAPACLERLGAAGVHVGSIARSGVGAEALDLIFQRVLPRYPRLQLIIILVGATDVLRWLEHGAPRTMPPVRTADVFRCHPEGSFGWNPGQTAVVELLRRARRRWLRPCEVHDRAGRWVGEARAMRACAKVIRTTLPDPAPMLDQFELHLRRLLRTASAHADRVIVVRQPWFDRAYSSEEAAHMWHGGAGQVWRTDVTTYYSFDVVRRLMALIDARAAATVNALGVEQVDLMPVLEGSLTNYYDCFHATPAGARVIATAVAAVVAPEQGAVADAPRSRAAAVSSSRQASCVASRAS
jgi:lysophospholipase L1-like esterase